MARFAWTALLAAAAVLVQPTAALPLFYRALAPRDSGPGVVGNIRIPPGYATTLFSDGFDAADAGLLPSPLRWTIDTCTQYPGGAAHWGTNEVETYTASTSNLVLTSSGTLQITPRLVTVGSTSAWTSGRIETVAAYDVTCALGKKLRMEARLKLGSAAASSQLGIWPAFWSLGAAFRSSQNWPAIGEIDIMESLNGNNRAYQTAHCGTASGGPCDEPDGIANNAVVYRGVWYTFAAVIDRSASASTADWQNESIAWLINDVTVFTLYGHNVNDQAAWTALAQTAKFLLLDVAVGGSFPDAVAGVTTPTSATAGGTAAALEVDYVAVFST